MNKSKSITVERSSPAGLFMDKVCGYRDASLMYVNKDLICLTEQVVKFIPSISMECIDVIILILDEFFF